MNKAILEGLLFVVGEDGLTIDQIKDVLNIDEDSAKKLIRELKHDYDLNLLLNLNIENTIKN